VIEGLEPGGLNKALGFEFEEVGPDRVVATWTVAPHHLQEYGIVHGGTYCAVIESTASLGAAVWFMDRGRVVGVANNTNFLRSVREGRLTAVATPVHRGRSQQLWQVAVQDEQDRLVARGEVRLQNLTD
jgi:uncharacterized protein (TIGR00369 family)